MKSERLLRKECFFFILQIQRLSKRLYDLKKKRIDFRYNEFLEKIGNTMLQINTHEKLIYEKKILTSLSSYQFFYRVLANSV